MARSGTFGSIVLTALSFLALTRAAEAKLLTMDVPAESLKTALDTYIQQARVQLVYTEEDVSGQRTQGVHGQLEANAALDQLLLGTDLIANRDVSGAVIVSKRVAVDPDPEPQSTEQVESVVVTGSRVISDITNSPTPLTVVSADQLNATTPSDLPDALNKLPEFEGDVGPRNATNAGSNATGAVLNLRNFGAQRTLVLLDGHRVTPANANGTVDADTLPEMLMSRVDVVTGGASSVYGSDAITGVVNFILDKHFEGLKLDINSGISNYMDAASYNAGLAAGTDLFGGRGHFEVSLRRFYQDGVMQNQRPQGPENWGLEGLGTQSDPYADIEYTGNTLTGGKISCTGCAANGMRLSNNGAITPYFIGTTTGTPNFTSGGNGGYTDNSSITAAVTQNESFARLSYDVNSDTTAYIQGSANEAYTKSAFQNYSFTSGVTGTFFTSNPYVPAADAALLANPSGTFSVAELFHEGFNRDGEQSEGLNRNLSVTIGADGTFFGKYNWDFYYTHGEDRLDEKAPDNENQQRMFAGEDAVTNASGQVSCYVSTTAYAYLYPGCVPADPFINANYLNPNFVQWMAGETTFFHQTSTLDDTGLSATGTIFDLPAGPVKAALSGEMRWLGYGVVSNASPTSTVNCTGLRICNSTAAVWHNNVVASLPTVTENVWEFAGEANAPILKDLPLVQAFDVDLAGRYTDYSTSGTVETWKIGLDWHVDDNVRFRATNSIDIRAPTLNDLFSPIQQGATSFTDQHTGTTAQDQTQSQGNPNLVPEVGRTYTAGVVLTPSILPGFSASLDYYEIVLKNAISTIAGTSNSVQTICNNSGGTSPFCALYVRPFPFSNTTPANFPSLVLSEELNTAFNKAEGWDFETDYKIDMSDIYDPLPGSVVVRLLANLQPVNETLQYVGAPLTFLPYSKGRVTGFVTYNIGDWSFGIEDRWYSNFTRATNYGIYYVNPRVPTRDYADINITKKFTLGSSELEGYFTIQNIANVQPPIAPTIGSVPGLFYLGSSPTQYDAIGRYFTIGTRVLF